MQRIQLFQMSITAIVERKRTQNSIHGFLHIHAEIFAVEYWHVAILAMNVVIQEDALLVLELLKLNVLVERRNGQFAVVCNIWS